jgi:hypothetical protein
VSTLPWAVRRVVPVVIVLFAAGPRAFGQQLSQGVAPCAAPEYRQFDFWLGDWDVF